MIQTNNFKFNKPESEDPVLIRDLNQNMDILDRELHSIDIAKIDKSRILTTMEEIEAVTEDGYLVDARCVGGLNSNLTKMTQPYNYTGYGTFTSVTGAASTGYSMVGLTKILESGAQIIYHLVFAIRGTGAGAYTCTKAGLPTTASAKSTIVVSALQNILNGDSTQDITGNITANASYNTNIGELKIRGYNNVTVLSMCTFRGFIIVFKA